MRSSYEGPETITPLRFGGRTIQVVHPADPDRLLTAPDVLAWNARDDYMPYWAYLWPGAFLLAEAVAATDWEPETTALEIGCGLGLAGLAALASGLNVRFTDYDEAPFPFIARSAESNGFDPARWSVGRLDWRDLPVGEHYPLILGADVLYERRLVPLVANLIRMMLAPGGQALVAGPYRVATEDLPAWLKTEGLIASTSPIASTDERGQGIRGSLHTIRRAD